MVGVDDGDARHVAAVEPTPDRARSSPQPRRRVDHDHRAPPATLVGAPFHGLRQRRCVAGCDQAGAMSDMREPAHPAPPGRVGRDHLQFPVGRSVVGGELDDDRSAQRLGDSGRAVHGDRRRRFQRKWDGDVDQTFAPFDGHEQLGVETHAVVDVDRRCPP